MMRVATSTIFFSVVQSWLDGQLAAPQSSATNIFYSLCFSMLSSQIFVSFLSLSLLIAGFFSCRSLRNLLKPPSLHSPIISSTLLPPGRNPLPGHHLPERTSSPPALERSGTHSACTRRTDEYHLTDLDHPRNDGGGGLLMCNLL
jgi:hypothetical protein